MKIVEYNHTYAQKVADMWKKSGSNWGNDEIFKTAQDIIDTESSSGNIKLYLALDNDEVVGYCSLSEYQHDEGASYLPLLNVIPEYHGKKVGKQLILKVLSDAIELEWPRFDLFTWSGNIKAMPLYKKCGFFWERRNNSVHLMNFLPYVYQTEALQQYVMQLDTYNDMKRPIDMDPDGRQENNFDFYRYIFKNDKLELNLEFEKSGRGLTLIDSPDYKIQMNVHEHELVYNNEYKVSFDIENKTDQPLDIKVVGKDNKNITFNYQDEVRVTKSKTLTGQYHVGPIVKDQDISRTHPVVEADVYINGELATFKIGIEPKHPITVKLYTEHYNHVLNKEYTAYLDLENNLSSEEEFTFSLPSNFVMFEDNIKTTLKSKEKRSIPVKYSLKDHGFYREDITVKYQTHEIETVVYTAFKGATKSFIGKTDYLYYMVSGNFIVFVNTKGGNAALKAEYGNDAVNAFMAPQLGKPYNLEFSNQIAEVEVINDNELTMTYTSKTFEGVKLVRHMKHTYGVLETKYEIINNGKEKEISLTIPVWQGVGNSYIPFDNKILFIHDYDDTDPGTVDTTKIDENWIYNKKSTFGFSWESDMKIKVKEWKFAFDVEDITLKENESYMTQNFYVTQVHKTLKDFRQFAGYTKERMETSYQEININNGNPFYGGQVDVSVLNNKKAQLKGTLEIDDQETDINDTVTVDSDFIKVKVIQEDKDTVYKRKVFKTSGEITKDIIDGSHTVSNGLLTFKANEEYADSVYSLVFDNYEYLDSNFPTPKERAWWGDFVGGITQRISGLQDISSLKEKRQVDFVNIKDSLGNNWEGVKVSLIIEKDPQYKGLQIDTYTITLPGVPVLYSFANVINKSGKLIGNQGFPKFNVLKLDDEKTKVTFKFKNKKYKCNNYGIEIDVDKFVQFKSDRDYNLAVYNPKGDLEVDTQKDYLILFSSESVTVPDMKNYVITGDFLIFTDKKLKESYLQDLKNIKFEV